MAYEFCYLNKRTHITHFIEGETIFITIEEW